MKVFVTGASGFIGSAVVKELVAAGHEVTGLARSDQSAKAIRDAGAQVLMGSLDDLNSLKHGASESDGVIHTAFIHDFSQYAKAAEADKAAIEIMGNALVGSDRPLIVTGGILGMEKEDGFITENIAAPPLPRASEATAFALADNGVNASVIRLPPSVHDKGDKGFIPFIISAARNKSVSAYIGDGNNRWPAVHRLDAAHLFCLALEKAVKGIRYNAIGDEGIPVCDLAEVIGKQLNLPVISVSPDEAADHFEWMARFIAFDSPATAYKTREQLGWQPTHIGLIEDMQKNYF